MYVRVDGHTYDEDPRVLVVFRPAYERGLNTLHPIREPARFSVRIGPVEMHISEFETIALEHALVAAIDDGKRRFQWQPPEPERTATR